MVDSPDQHIAGQLVNGMGEGMQHLGELLAQRAQRQELPGYFGYVIPSEVEQLPDTHPLSVVRGEGPDGLPRVAVGRTDQFDFVIGRTPARLQLKPGEPDKQGYIRDPYMIAVRRLDPATGVAMEQAMTAGVTAADLVGASLDGQRQLTFGAGKLTIPGGLKGLVGYPQHTS